MFIYSFIDRELLPQETRSADCKVFIAVRVEDGRGIQRKWIQCAGGERQSGQGEQMNIECLEDGVKVENGLVNKKWIFLCDRACGISKDWTL
jgi:hypothetical protein